MSALSVLDLAFITTADGPTQAIRNAVALARHVDGLGYTRFWLAEHHSMPSVACTAPELLIGQIAGATQRIRVGSGGIMLPNHAPLMVAERFKTLEALFPGRIDLGLGRAPGTDPVTSYALRHRQAQEQGDEFVERLQELLFWAAGRFPEGHPFAKIRVQPEDVPLPPLYILGSSDYGAALAAQIGVGYAFAHHFASFDATMALQDYRRRFQPGALDKPHAILAVAVVCADTDAEAEHHAASLDFTWLRRARGEYLPLPSPEEALGVDYSEVERRQITMNRKRLFVGSPATVMARLHPLIEATGADEVMVTSAIFDQAARRRSYSLLAEAFGVSAPAAAELEPA